MACSIQLYNCMYCRCMDKPTKLNTLLGVSILQEYISSSHQTCKQRWAGPRNSAVLGYSGRAEVQEVHRSSQQGVTSHCRAEWGMLLVSRSGVPSGKQCLISILSCFQVVVFFCLCSWSEMPSTKHWCFDPGMYTHVSWFSLFLLSTSSFHVRFCSSCLCFLLLEHEHAHLLRTHLP